MQDGERQCKKQWWIIKCSVSNDNKFYVLKMNFYKGLAIL